MLNFSSYNLSEMAVKAKIRASVGGVGRKKTTSQSSSGGTASVKPSLAGKKSLLIPLSKPAVKSRAKVSTGRYPWLSTTTNLAGWWHPSGKFITFIWAFKRPYGEFHTTQVFNNPELFGYTDQELLKFYCDDSKQYDDYKSGALDYNSLIMDSMEKKGWMRTHHSDSVYLTGAIKSTYIKALQDILLSIPPSKDGSVSFEVPETLKYETLATKRLNSIEEIEKYLSLNK